MPAFTSCVKIVSITSSLSALSSARAMCFAPEGGELDLQERALLAVGLGDIDDQEVGENQFGQPVTAVRVRGPVSLPIQAVPEGEVGVQPCAVGALVALRELKRILHVVEVPDLEISIDRVELLRSQHHVLHLGPPNPLDPNVERPACQRLCNQTDQFGAAQERAVDLDDEAEDVLAIEIDRARIGELQLPGRDRLQRRGSIHHERIPADPGEHVNAVRCSAVHVVDAEFDRLASRRGARAVLLNALVAVGVRVAREHAVEYELLRVRDKRNGIVPFTAR